MVCPEFFQNRSKESSNCQWYNFEVRILEHVKFNDVVKFHQIDKFDEIIMESLNDHIFSMNNATLPLWKINVFEEMRPNGNQFISVSFDHSNYDGLSGVQFQKDLAKELSTAKDDLFYDVLFDYQRDFGNLPAKILPAVDNLTDLFDLGVLLSSSSILKNGFHFMILFVVLFGHRTHQIFDTDITPVTKNLQTKYKF